MHRLQQELPPVAILAGGLGTRLGPDTQNIPKALIEIAGKPFIVRQLELLHDRGLRRVVVCAGHLGVKLQDALGDGKRYGMELTFAFDGPHLLGTAGALKQSLPLLGDVFFVLYGDSYLDFKYTAPYDTFRKSGKSGLMTVYRNDNAWDRSNVQYENGNILAYSKTEPSAAMHHIDYGLGILTRQAFSGVPELTAYDLADLYRTLIKEGGLAAYEVRERFYEIGSPKGLDEMRAHFANR